MAKKLTDIAIRNAKPREQRYEVSDGGHEPRLIVQPSGHKSFAVRFRDGNGTPCKLTLGSPPALSLAMARKAAADVLLEVSRGNDPAKARTDAKIKAAEAKADTLAAVCASYIKREGAKLRTVDQRVSILARHVYPTMGDRPVSEIRRSEIVHMLDRIEDNSGARMADVVLAILRRIFNWHATRDDEFRSPVVRGMGRQNVSEHRRSRILNDDELRAVWTAAIAGPFGALVRLALLTTARRGEIAGMKWGEVSAEGVWTLPASRSKMKAEIVRPLSKAALAILDAQPRIAGCDYIFTTNGRSPIKSFSEPKRALDTKSGVISWRIHDLRRSARSLLSRAGVNADIAERCLGHAMPGVRGVYDRHKYLDEQRHAFEALSALIERITCPPEDNVVSLRR
jgi:integrase